MNQDARAAKNEIEDIRHCERMKCMRSSAHSTDTPADVYLERIRQREEQVMRRRPLPEYRTPAYIQQGKDVLYQAEEKRRSFEENRYPLDATYLCEEQSPEEEEISRRISEIFDQIQSEVKTKTKDPKQTSLKIDPIKRPKAKPNKSSKVDEKKALYAELRAGNEYHRLQANIGRLKVEEEELKRKTHITDRSAYKSPYQRTGLPQSYPLAPPQSYHLAPSQSYLVDTPQAIRQSAPILAPRKPISTQTSPLHVKIVDPAEYTRLADRSPRQMIDQQCSPLKTRDVIPKTRDVTPKTRDVTAEMRDISRDTTEQDGFIEVVDVTEQIVIYGNKQRQIPRDSKILGTTKSRGSKPDVTFPHQDSDKISVMQWLEDLILEKLLAPSTHTQPINTELTSLLGQGTLDKISALQLDLTPEQLHVLVSGIVREQVEEQIEAAILEEEHTKPSSPREERKSGEYEETFESSTSTSSSSSSSPSSLSVVRTPSVTTESKSPGERSSPRSPIFTPPLTPEQSSHQGDTRSHTGYRIHPSPDVQRPAPPLHQGDTRAPPLHDTLEQLPLDQTEEHLSYASVATPDLTIDSRDVTTTRSRDVTRTRDLMTSRDLPPPTPLNTQILSDSLVSQHPLDATQQSLISQQPLDSSQVSQRPLDSTHVPHQPVNLSQVSQQLELSNSTTGSITETTDFPISAGEVLRPGLSDLANEAFGGGPLSEGEWPLSPDSLLQFVRDPDIRELIGQRVRATRYQEQDAPQHDYITVRPRTPRTVPEGRTLEPRTLPPQPRRMSVQTPSPIPKTRSIDNFETLELVTPLPDSVELESPSPPLFSGQQPRAPLSPSPPPFMGLQLEDYNFMSEESVTRSDSF